MHYDFLMVNFLKHNELLIAIVIVSISLLACVGILVFQIVPAFNGICDGPPQILHEIVSPAGDKKAIAYLTDCGATTAFTPRVSVLWANDKLEDERGFVGRPVKGQVYVGPYAGIDVGIRWIDNETLSVDSIVERPYVECVNSTNPPTAVKCR